MARKTIATSDASDAALAELDYVIKKRPTFTEGSTSPSVEVASAMKGERMYRSDVQRDITRVLFISKNTELLNPTRQTLDGFIDLSDLFDEVHIVILRTGIPPKNPVIRVSDNVWLYTAAASVWWLMPSAGLEMVDEQMVFANGFRADLVVARDQFESAAVAYKLHKMFGVPIQLHFEQPRVEVAYLHRLMARYFIPKFPSVRTVTGQGLSFLRKRFDIPDLAQLPRFHNYQALINRTTELDLKHTHQPILFFMLYVGPLTSESELPKVLQAAKPYLRNPRIGLIVIGDGPMRSSFMKLAKKLEIDSQVIFKRAVNEIVAYYQHSQVLIVPDVHSDSEELVLQGAAAGVPVIMAETERRADLFEHGVSGFVYPKGDTVSIAQHIDELLHDVALRHSIVTAAQTMIKATFHEDPSDYRNEYRASVEEALFVGSEEVGSTEAAVPTNSEAAEEVATAVSPAS